MNDAASGARSSGAPSPPRGRLHDDPPLTLLDVEARARWLLPVVAVAFVVLALLARFDALPWDRPITDWVVDHRTHSLNRLAKRVTWFGSNPVVFTVAAVCALVAWPRCRPLALCIVVLAASRAGITTGLKEIIERDRPAGIDPARGPGRLLVPERPSVRHGGELGLHPARARALHAPPVDLVDVGRRRVDVGGGGRLEPRLGRRALDV